MNKKKINIFYPCYHRFESTKRSLSSLLPSVTSSEHYVNLYICDNNSPVEMRDWLKSLVNKRVVIYLLQENYGKAVAVNHVYNLHNECDYVISCDSDLVWEGKSNWIDEMVWCMERGFKFGLLAVNQVGNGQHLSGLTETTILRDESGKEHTIIYGKYNSIAGGCVCVRKKYWDKVKGYNEYGKKFGYDDAVLMMNINDYAIPGVISSLPFYHPFDTDEGYAKWKKQNIRNRPEKGYYESYK
jgi:hypothetical protein